MNNLMQVFKNNQFGELQVFTDEEGELWFIADEVCKALELTNTSKAIAKLDEDERNTITNSYSIRQRGNPTRTIINESGLYSLIFTSRKKEAKEFKRWVTHEVLPSIRKHGFYVSDNYETITVDELAKLWASDSRKELGRNRAFEILRLSKHLMSHGRHKNVPYQKYIDNGHMLYVTSYKSNDFGAKSFNVVRIPEKYVDYFFKVFDKYYELHRPLSRVKQIKLF